MMINFIGLLYSLGALCLLPMITFGIHINSLIFGTLFVLLATYLSFLMFLFVREDKKIKEIEEKLYKELGNLSIEEAEKLIESKENRLENKSKGSKIKEFYFKNIKSEFNEQYIAKRILKKIVKGREIKESKRINKELKKKLNNQVLKEDKKEIKIISI